MNLRESGNDCGIPIEVLVVEDSSADQKLIAEILKDSECAINLTFLSDGEEAIGYLTKNGQFTRVLRPDLILLDLNLPRKNGYEVLSALREAEELREIPVLVLTTSELPDDRTRCRDLDVNCYLTKQSDLDKFGVILKAVEPQQILISPTGDLRE